MNATPPSAGRGSRQATVIRGALRSLCLLVLAGHCLLVSAQGDPPRLGRLFLTPQARDAIDARRLATPATPTVRTEGASTSDAPARPQAVRLDGVVRRSAGPSVVWLDGTPHQLGPGHDIGTAAGLRLDGDSVTIVDRHGDARKLRAGESAQAR